MTTRRTLATVALGLCLGFPGLAKAQYTFTTYDVPGSTRTAVNGNSPHAIAGEFDDASGILQVQGPFPGLAFVVRERRPGCGGHASDRGRRIRPEGRTVGLHRACQPSR